MKAYTPLSSRVTALLHAFVPLLNEFQQARHVRARAVPAGCRRPPRAPMGASFDTTAARGGLEEASEGHSHVLTQSVPCSRTGERDGLLDGSKPSEMLHEIGNVATHRNGAPQMEPGAPACGQCGLGSAPG